MREHMYISRGRMPVCGFRVDSAHANVARLHRRGMLHGRGAGPLVHATPVAVLRMHAFVRCMHIDRRRHESDGVIQPFTAVLYTLQRMEPIRASDMCHTSFGRRRSCRVQLHGVLCSLPVPLQVAIVIRDEDAASLVILRRERFGQRCSGRVAPLARRPLWGSRWGVGVLAHISYLAAEPRTRPVPVHLRRRATSTRRVRCSATRADTNFTITRLARRGYTRNIRADMRHGAAHTSTYCPISTGRELAASLFAPPYGVPKARAIAARASLTGERAVASASASRQPPQA